MSKVKKILFVLVLVVSIVSLFALNTFAVSVNQIVIYNPSVSIQTYSRNQYTTYSTNYGGNIASRFNGDSRTSFWQTGNIDTSTQLTVFSIYEGSEYYTVYEFVSRNSFSANIDFGLLGYKPSDFVDGNKTFYVQHGGYVVGNNFDYTLSTQPSVLNTQVNVIKLDTSYYEREETPVAQLFTEVYQPNIDTFTTLFYSQQHGDYFIKSVNFKVDYNQDLIQQGYTNQTFRYYVQVRSSHPLFTDFDNSVMKFEEDNTDYALSTTYNYSYSEGYAGGFYNGYSDGYYIGYDGGYSIGYNEGNNVGYANGYDLGQTEGYNTGYTAGYNEGYEDGLSEDGIFGFIIESVEAFLSAQLFPGFSFGLLLTSILGVCLLIWLLKVFAGG